MKHLWIDPESGVLYKATDAPARPELTAAGVVVSLHGPALRELLHQVQRAEQWKSLAKASITDAVKLRARVSELEAACDKRLAARWSLGGPASEAPNETEEGLVLRIQGLEETVSRLVDNLAVTNQLVREALRGVGSLDGRLGVLEAEKREGEQ